MQPHQVAHSQEVDVGILPNNFLFPLAPLLLTTWQHFTVLGLQGALLPKLAPHSSHVDNLTSYQLFSPLSAVIQSGRGITIGLVYSGCHSFEQACGYKVPGLPRARI